MGERRAVKTTAVLWSTAVVVVVVGCAPEPAPTPLPLPTATGFASDEEAFAAAEATYRAYVDAVNARRADPNAPDPMLYLSGAARESSERAQQRFAAEGVRLVGETAVTGVIGLVSNIDEMTIRVCIDSSNTSLIDSSGVDVTPAGRAVSGALEVELTWTVDRLLITDSSEGSGSC